MLFCHENYLVRSLHGPSRCLAAQVSAQHRVQKTLLLCLCWRAVQEGTVLSVQSCIHYIPGLGRGPPRYVQKQSTVSDQFDHVPTVAVAT